MAGSDDEIPPPPPPQTQTPTQQAPHTVSTIKLPILKKGEYDIWAMKMEHYLAHTDYPIWEVIQRGNGPVSVSTDTNGVIKVLPPKTAEEILARERERKARTTLLMALPEDHLAKFHKMTDAKEMWEAIKSRFGGNDESKKMQKYILKQQFEGFSVSNSKGLHKGYDRFQSLLSQLEIHGAGVSPEDANQNFLRSLPFAWSQISLIIRTKPGVDSLSFDDLYNNLRVFEPDVKGSTASSSRTPNVAFVSENTSSTNEISTAYGASSSSGHNPQREGSSSYTDELMYSFFANQSMAMISIRLKKFYKKTRKKLQFDAKEPVAFDKAKVQCYNCHKTRHFARECRSKGNQDSRRRDVGYTGYKAKDGGRRIGKQEEPKALVTLDGEGVDWTSHSKDEQENYALMAYSNSVSDTEREQLGDASIEIQAYTQALKKVEAQLKLLAEAEKEKEELKAKVEKWHNSSKNLNILLTSQMSARDKAGLGYGNQMNKGVLSYENEVFESVFYSRSSDIEDSPVNDRYAEGMHAVPPPMTGIYIPSGPDVEIDESQFTYGPKQSKPSEYDARSSDFNSCESNSSEETLTSMPEPVVNEPKVVSQPKVWSDAPIIEEYESDSDDEHVSLPTKEQETPSFAFVNTVKHVKTPRQTVKEQNTCSQNPKPDKKDCSGLMSKKLGLGYGFTKKACFICGSFSHLIRDCDFHEKRMTKQAELNKRICKGTGKGKISQIPVNTARASSTNNVNTARHNFNSQAAPTNAARKVNTVKPIDVPHKALENKGIVDSGCSRHMTGNKAYLAEYQDYNELQHFNLFSVSQMCDKKNKVLFTDTECLVLSPDFKLPDENQVLLRVPRQNNMYSFNLENIVPSGGLACLIAKATIDESNKWHRRLGHVNFKNLNKLVKGNLPVRLENQAYKNAGPKEANHSADDTQIPALEDSYDNPNDGIFTNASYDDEGVVADFTNLETIMNEELLQFKIQKVWILIDLPHGKKAIRTKWVYRNEKDERGVVVRNKASRSDGGEEVHSFMHNVEEVYVFNLSYVDPKCLKKSTKRLVSSLWFTPAPRACLGVMEFEAFDEESISNGSMGESFTSFWITKSNRKKMDIPHKALENKGIVDSGCSKHMTGNKAYLVEYQDYNGGPIAFGGSNVAAANCCGQNLVFHSKTKHIEIRNHFIRDAYEKKLIQAALVKGKQVDLLYSLYEVFCEQKNLDDGDVFHRVIWVPESNWKELSMVLKSSCCQTCSIFG
ncbi:ribonuclease H-like domain-containing protein [Tanacetum coccineum]